MNRYILTGVGVLLFCSSHAQQLDNTQSEREVVSTASYTTVSNESVDRFTLTKDGEIAETHNDRRLYTGTVRNKKLHGNWQSWYQNGSLCDSGKFVKGLPDGEWKHWDPAGRLIALRTYNADKYQRIYLDMSRYNPRRPNYPLTAMYQRNKNAAMQYLHSSYSFPHKVKRIDDLSLQQWVIANITPGNSYHPVFDQSLHHGLYMNYFNNGQAKDSGYYQNGLRQGIWVEKESQDSGWQLGSYNNGKKSKEWKCYNAKGILTEIIFYNNKGEIKSRKQFRSR